MCMKIYKIHVKTYAKITQTNNFRSVPYGASPGSGGAFIAPGPREPPRSVENG